MKWKIGALLMAGVFCIAILPPLISGARAGGTSNSVKEIVFQMENERALADGQIVTLGDANAVPYQAEDDSIMVPLRGLSDTLNAEMGWDNASQTATLTLGKKSLSITVGSDELTSGEEKIAVSSPAINSGGTLFVPAEAVSSALGWQIATTTPDQGSFAILCNQKKELSEKDIQKKAAAALTHLGQPRSKFLAETIIFRVNSDYVISDGENIDLVDSSGIFYTPLVEEQVLYLPAAATICALGGTAEIRNDGAAALSLGEIEAQVNADGTVSLNGQQYEEGETANAVFYDAEEKVTYATPTLLAELFGLHQKVDGEIALLGRLPFDNANSQISYLIQLGETLPDARPSIPKADAYVALTFDDGPTGGADGRTARLLTGLKERGAHATFFMCGYRVKDFHTHMDRYLSEGHEVGNHTMDHPGLLTKMKLADIQTQIDSNNDLIASYVGEKPTVFRPVGGAVNDDVITAAKNSGIPIVNWSVDTLDWKIREAEHIKNVIVQQAKDGDIVLMHDLRECTIDGALAAIDILKEKGYAFVTVSELARIKGIVLEPGVEYHNLRDSTVAEMKKAS